MTRIAAFMAGVLPVLSSSSVCSALSDDVGALGDDIGAFNLAALAQQGGQLVRGAVNRMVARSSSRGRAPQGRQLVRPAPQVMQAPQYQQQYQPAPYYGPGPVSPLAYNSIPAGIYAAGWSMFSFAAATGVAAITLDLNPIAALKGRRFTCLVLRSGTTAAATAPVIVQLMAGAIPMIIGGEVAAETFGPAATDTNLTLPPISPGQFYRLSIRLPVALGGTDTIIVLPSLTGDG